MSRLLSLFTLTAVGLLVVACDGEGDAARAELAKAEQACSQGEPDKALEIMAAAAEGNEAFGEAWSFATAGLVDKASIKPCGTVLKQIQAHLGE